ncbi:hypothetical protein GGTG_09475 [Gaeumannomyces tritici R3-111a-1]|uniref:Uncharacterized protein n=1 Tax=Gaeumannomyces tritici (strain R3-111a-1) TaxID=644352 RepID=J3P7I4_GAET3|nr:hypothetical protein GGTG_09475 [Gaeumannomyces tritici R3-111a-1]EJT72615.1 hypothetical protein GGTG_09475 [Gaeumannomyces tritici R3-111a-1]
MGACARLLACGLDLQTNTHTRPQRRSTRPSQAGISLRPIRQSRCAQPPAGLTKEPGGSLEEAWSSCPDTRRHTHSVATLRLC